MKPRVQQKLEKIFSYPLFKSVGNPLPNSVTPVKSWSVAIEMCSSLKWENCQLMARNVLQRAIESQYPKPGVWERMQEWNSVTQEIRPAIDSFAESLLPQVPVPIKEKTKFKNNVRWDFLFLCLECEYSDIVEPVFSTKYLEPWYASGHFPCGWDGEEFPERWDGIVRAGKLMVF